MEQSNSCKAIFNIGLNWYLIHCIEFFVKIIVIRWKTQIIIWDIQRQKSIILLISFYINFFQLILHLLLINTFNTVISMDRHIRYDIITQ